MDKPVRKIGRNSRSVVGYVSKQSKDVLVQFESTLERDFIQLLEFDKNVMDYVEQPLTIEYLIEGKKRYYTPDFLVRYMPKSYQKKSTLFEIKYSEDLIKLSAELKPKFDAAKAYCKRNGYEFKVITENDIRSPYLANVKFLLFYKDKLNVVNGYDLDMLMDKISEDPIPASELLSLCTEIFEKKAELTYALWVLVANNRVQCDLSKRLTMSSKIWIE